MNRKNYKGYRRTLADWLGFFGFTGAFIAAHLIVEWLCF